jgi:hypothetical protein
MSIATRFRSSWLPLVVSWVFVSPAVTAAVEPTLSLPPSLRDFLDTHCVSCHRGDNRKGGLDLENCRL